MVHFKHSAMLAKSLIETGVTFDFKVTLSMTVPVTHLSPSDLSGCRSQFQSKSRLIQRPSSVSASLFSRVFGRTNEQGTQVNRTRRRVRLIDARGEKESRASTQDRKIESFFFQSNTSVMTTDLFVFLWK